MGVRVSMLSDEMRHSRKESRPSSAHVRVPVTPQSVHVLVDVLGRNVWCHVQVFSMVAKLVAQGKEPASLTLQNRRLPVAVMMDRSVTTALNNALKVSVNKCVVRMASALWTGSRRRNATV